MKKPLKRLPAPRSWKIARKEFVWAYKPRPGPHPAQAAMPLAMVLRDMLRVAGNAREAETLAFARSVLVEGKAHNSSDRVGRGGVEAVPRPREEHGPRREIPGPAPRRSDDSPPEERVCDGDDPQDRAAAAEGPRRPPALRAEHRAPHRRAACA